MCRLYCWQGCSPNLLREYAQAWKNSFSPSGVIWESREQLAL